MKTITTNNRTLLFVEVPETAHHFSIEQGYLTWLNVSDSEDVLAQLPSGNYRFISTTDTITEQQAAELVECMSRPTGGDDYMIYYKRYTGSQEDADFPWFSEMNNGASKSFATLLQHHSITGRHAIIEVIH